jgi:UDP-N-acetylglucosamine 2-epimerase (non-hydrolysing)
MKKTVMTLTGIRPDFIRMQAVFKRLDESEKLNHILVHSGQHYDKMLSGVFFDELEIRKPDFNLYAATHLDGKSHPGRLAAKVSEGIGALRSERGINPDIIMFLGDSHSALAAPFLRKDGFKIAHIEAGMRSYDMEMPEEVNRICCDHMCDFLFTYHPNYAEKLRKEGIHPSKIHVVGNTIVEVANQFLPELQSRPKELDCILMDIHRPENIQSPSNLKNILVFANECSVRFQLPVKMVSFGRTVQAIADAGLAMGSVEWVPLMSYKEYLQSQYDAVFMISDSGTAQEEPALLDTPVVVPRISTERPESVNLGCSKMLNVQESWPGDVSWDDCLDWLGSMETVDFVAVKSWLGEGNTAEKIVSILEEKL